MTVSELLSPRPPCRSWRWRKRATCSAPPLCRWPPRAPRSSARTRPAPWPSWTRPARVRSWTAARGRGGSTGAGESRLLNALVGHP
ncbi:hypothetical protein QJS66_00710 [Kocuria rhizophila]|nr:hypothetical protein QJS66_00710 [Kocuria rhizophila]